MEKEKKLKRPEKPKQKRPGQAGGPSFLGRLFTFLLTLVLGMAIVIAAEVGILYAAFGWVTLDRLEEYGISVGDGVLTDDSVLREMTVIGLVSEIASLPGKLADLTFNTMVQQYGVILSEDVRELLPAALLDVPLSELTGPDGFHVALSHITFSDVLAIAGEELIPEPVRLKIGDRTLDLAFDRKFDLVFEGVFVADFVGVTLEKDADGVYQPLPNEGEDLTFLSYAATLNLGEYFAAEDGNTVLQATLDRTPMDVIINGGDGNIVYTALADNMLGDILKLEDGGAQFNLDVVMEDLYLGDALGYKKNADGVFCDKDGKPAKGIYREFVDILVKDLGDTDLEEKIDGLYVAELMNYERREVLDGDGNPVLDEDDQPVYEFFMPGEGGTETYPEGLVGEFATMKVGDLRDDTKLDAKIKSLQVGVALGYTYVENESRPDDPDNGVYNGVWFTDADATVKATGVLRPLLSTSIENLSASLDELYLGEVMGFDNIAADGEDPVFMEDVDGDGEYLDDNSVPGPLMAHFVDMQLKDINDESKFTERVQGVRVGHAMGYTYVPPAGMTDPEDEDYYKGGVWYSVYTESTRTPVEGVFATLSSYRVSEMESAIPDLKVADALGYRKDGNDWVKGEGASAQKASGILALLMDSTLEELPGKTDSLFLGEIMGYEKYDRGPDDLDGTTDDDESSGNIGFRKPNPDPATAATRPYLYPSGAVSEFADMTVKQLENGDTITEKIKGMKVGTAMSYTKIGNTWYDDHNNPVENSFLLAVIDKNVGELGAAMDQIPLGELMGYHFEPDGSITDKDDPDYYTAGTWYSVWDEDTPANNVASTGGYLSIIGLDTRLPDLNHKLEILDHVTVKQLTDAQILTLDTSAVAALETRFAGVEGWEGYGWENHTIDCFINAVIATPSDGAVCSKIPH